jgi:manganese/zinc/iron transport system permease protein
LEWTFTLRNVLLGSALLGLVGGMAGSFAVLRRQSLLGDALAHAALPGVCLAFLITGTKASLPLLAGALAAGLLGALVVLAVVRWSRVKEDAAMGLVLSVFFGAGIVLLTRIQKLPGGNQSGLDKFLFGQAATLGPDDVRLMAWVGAAVLGSLLFLFKEMKVVSFDPDYARSLGLPVRALEVLLTALLVAVVVTGLQTVGVVLMVATLVTPAAAARQWTDRLGVMVAISGLFGAAAGAAGAVLSASVPRLPTGPTIVLLASGVLLVSLLLAPRRGILWGRLRRRRVQERIRRENLLKDVWMQGEATGGWDAAVPAQVLMGIRGRTAREFQATVRPLVAEGLLEAGGEAFRLTPSGRREAERLVRNHRLWELYLTRRLELRTDHVHRDAEAMEHALTDEVAADLERILGHPTEDPHGRKIPARGSP